MAHFLVALLLVAASALFGPTTAAAQAIESDIWLVALSTTAEGDLRFGVAENVTRRPGYDNQPHFTPDGSGFWFTIYDDHTLQSDIWRYDVGPGTVAQIVASNPESEYSATPLPDGSGISAVRVEADSTQRLWRFDLRGNNSAPILPELQPVGYHAWADPETAVLFVLGAPPTLVVADVTGGAPPRVVASNVGRSLQRIPGTGRVSFVQRDDGGAGTIMALDPASDEITPIAPVLDRARDDHAFTPDGRLLQGLGSTLHAWDPEAQAWVQVVDLGPSGPRNITRLAVSPRGDVVAVVDVVTLPGLAGESEGAAPPAGFSRPAPNSETTGRPAWRRPASR